MRKMIMIFALIGMLSGCGESEPNVEIEAYDKTSHGIPYLEVKVKAISDLVIVEDIIVNRGNCKMNKSFITGRAIIPKELFFGDTVSVSFNGCDVTEIDVITSDGSWTVSY